MTTAQTSPHPIETLEDLLRRLGGISPARVRFRPAPGMATEQDLVATGRHEDRPCELIDGALVEKAMGFREACLAGALLALLRAFIIPRNLGLVSGADGLVRLAAGLVRVPDVAFISWERVPDRRMPEAPVPSLVPDLAVEVLSEGNTEEEMARKRREYFTAGVREVWTVDPRHRSVTIHRSPDLSTLLGETETLGGGEVLPGFALPLRELFSELDRRADG
jgi:Uma2 family endonuclease